MKTLVASLLDLEVGVVCSSVFLDYTQSQRPACSLVKLGSAWMLHSPGHEFLHILNVMRGWIITCLGKNILAMKGSAQLCVCSYA